MKTRASATQHLDRMLSRYPALVPCGPGIQRAAEAVCGSVRRGGKALVCGNGGSAADSEHIVGELMKGFLLRRRLPETELARLRDAGIEDWAELGAGLQMGIPAVALTGHVSLTTAVINDNDPQMIFAQQVYALGRPGDVLIGLSTSGTAKNVINALKVARARSLLTIGMTGERESPFDRWCDILIQAPSSETFIVQEFHLPLYHTLCAMVEEELFADLEEA